MGCKMRIVTYLSGFKAKNSNNAITHDNVFEVMRELEGRWCRPFTGDIVGTVLFQINGDRVFCRSIMKPKNIEHITIAINVEKDFCVKAKVRLPLDFDDNEANVKNLLANYSCDVENISYKKLPFSSLSFRDGDAMVDIPCADFELDIIIKNLEGFKKAYIQGIGSYKDYGCGMITLNNNQIVQEDKDS